MEQLPYFHEDKKNTLSQYIATFVNFPAQDQFKAVIYQKAYRKIEHLLNYAKLSGIQMQVYDNSEEKIVVVEMKVKASLEKTKK